MGSAAVAAAAFTAWRVVTHNEGVVEPGRLYRSAQLDGAELHRVIQRDGIRTVINLRGEGDGAGWYRDELAVCRELGVNHVDVRWSAEHLPPPDEVAKLLAAYRDQPGPLLVHCRSGSDRSGLASALFLIDRDHVPWREARHTLSWSYGHFAIYPYFPMDEFVQLYGQSSGQPLSDWVAQDYPALYAEKSRASLWEQIIAPFQLALTGSL